MHEVGFQTAAQVGIIMYFNIAKVYKKETLQKFRITTKSYQFNIRIGG